ncbi:LysR substrate-binding domain-containing protein [Roseiarcaceae bacterium H3SJ34-1]|uniref:LysR substrate-binding domain-containing protein n=1 Tax=Terripilifer ovatus TaxID=3032367 RepID=UPI003AB9B9CB|nr:LysR substrate-binding domain-containing protein [Roseiarcaceae bacterium H3SJ34-1]
MKDRPRQPPSKAKAGPAKAGPVKASPVKASPVNAGRAADVGAPRRLKPHQLEVFSAIVSAGSITGAAKLLNISQPGVSRSLADFEREIGFALFVRDKKRLFITPEGSAFYEELTRSYTGLDRLAKAAQEIRQMRRGHLRILAMPALCYGAVPRAIKTFLDRHDALHINFEAQNSQRVVESIASQYIDIGIAQVPASYPGVAVHSSFRSDCVCVMPVGHPLCSRKVVRPADLQNQAFVTLPVNSMAGQQIGHLLAEAGINVVARMETLTSFAACAMVAEGVGIAIVDAFTASAVARGRIEQRPFRPNVNFGFRLIYPEHRILSSAAHTLLEHLAKSLGADPLVSGRS